MLLASLLEDPSALEAALALVEGIDHVGFMAPHLAEPELADAAAGAGFGDGQETFASEIIALELGALLETDRVEATIFKAYRGAAGNGRVAAEVSMPAGVGADVIRGWIAREQCSHIALRVGARADLTELAEVMNGQGFEVPAFMSEGPLRNPADDSTAIYLDRTEPAGKLRIELCHYG